MKKPLKQVVQDHLETLSLDEEQLDKLMDLQQSKTQPMQINHFRWYKVAAVLVMFVLASFVVISQYHLTQTRQQGVLMSSSGNNDLIQKIANEVAGNHLKMKPMEVKTGEIDSVQRYFTKLDFLPLHSEQIASNTPVSLAGARYCSIQGSTAAQLRYKDQSDSYVTLFETPYDEELFKRLPHLEKGESPIVTYARGIKVTMWVERGLLMVSTKKPE